MEFLSDNEPMHRVNSFNNSNFIKFLSQPIIKIKTVEISWGDIFFFFLVIAVVFLNYYGKLMEYHVRLNVQGDAGIISSFAIAADHPEIFIKDALLSNVKVLSFYVTAQIPIIRFLTRFTGDYGISYLILGIPTEFLFFIGFYFLGRQLFHNRFISALLVILVTLRINYNSWDFWGEYPLALPRVMFQAFFPYILMLAYHYYDRPKKWAFILACIGCIFYFHVISGVGLAFIILFGLLCSSIQQKRFRKNLIYLISSSFIFLLLISPYIFTYFSNQTDPATINYNEGYLFFLHMFTSIFNMKYVASTYVSSLWASGILGFTILFAILFLFVAKPSKSIQLTLYWIAASILIGIIIPWIEHGMEARLRILPIQMDLIRELRFSIPLFETLILLMIVQISGVFKEHGVIISEVLLSLFLVFAATIQVFGMNADKPYYYPYLVIRQMVGLSAINNRPIDQAKMDMLNYLRTQPASGESYIAHDDEIAPEFLRYYARKAVAFSVRDIYNLAYNDLSNSLRLNRYYSKYIEGTEPVNATQFIKIVASYCYFKPDYLIIKTDSKPGKIDPNKLDKIKLTYQNEYYSIYKINEFCLSANNH
jgi:hypothetical protein